MRSHATAVIAAHRPRMARSAAWFLTCLVGLLAPALAAGELLRYELNPQRSTYPQTFVECEQRLREDASIQVQWTDQPWYDPHYSANGGATVGNISFMRGSTGYTDTLTWLQFDSPEAAVQYGIDAASWGSAWYQTRCEGSICLQVYASSGNPADMDAVFETVLRNR